MCSLSGTDSQGEAERSTADDALGRELFVHLQLCAPLQRQRQWLAGTRFPLPFHSPPPPTARHIILHHYIA
jgi:hypothetical protein